MARDLAELKSMLWLQFERAVVIQDAAYDKYGPKGLDTAGHAAGYRAIAALGTALLEVEAQEERARAAAAAKATPRSLTSYR